MCISFIQEVETFLKVKTEIFKSAVWSEIEAELTQGWAGCSPDTLMLLLACQKYHPVKYTTEISCDEGISNMIAYSFLFMSG